MVSAVGAIGAPVRLVVWLFVYVVVASVRLVVVLTVGCLHGVLLSVGLCSTELTMLCPWFGLVIAWLSVIACLFVCR